MLLYSNKVAPSLGTNGNGSDLVFGNPKYRFLVETDSESVKWGIILITFGFLLQMFYRVLEKHTLLRRFIFGAAVGLFIYIIAT